jgi:hypothetical protein
MIVSCTGKRIFEGEGPVAALVEGSPLQSSTRTQRKRIQSRRFHHLATRSMYTITSPSSFCSSTTAARLPFIYCLLFSLLLSQQSTIRCMLQAMTKDRKIRCLAFCRREHKCCHVEDASEHPRDFVGCMCDDSYLAMRMAKDVSLLKSV